MNAEQMLIREPQRNRSLAVKWHAHSWQRTQAVELWNNRAAPLMSLRVLRGSLFTEGFFPPPPPGHNNITALDDTMKLGPKIAQSRPTQSRGVHKLCVLPTRWGLQLRATRNC